MPIYCTGTMSEQAGTDITLAFSSGGADQIVLPDPSMISWDDFFSNSDTTNCPITNIYAVRKHAFVARDFRAPAR